MKTVIVVLATLLIGATAQAGASKCVGAAEQAAYNKFASSDSGSFGAVQNGGTDVVWVRDGIASYQVSIVHRKPDSSTFNYANYSVRVRLSDCAVINLRKF